MTDRPTLGDIQRAAAAFREKGNSVMALRQVLATICGEPLNVVSDVPEGKRAEVIAALDGKSGASAFVTREGTLNPEAIMANWNNRAGK